MNDDRTLLEKPNLPEQIRNLPDGVQPEGDGDAFCRGFRFGHRAACHAAAELAAAALSAAPAQEPVAYIDPMTFAALRRFTDRGGVLTTITPHRAFPDDVPLYASPLQQEPQEVKALTDSDQMRAEFMAWVQDRGCDTDGAWSAWQACWNLRGTQEVKAGEWLPIASAPNDGTVILYCDKRGNRWTDASPGHSANGCGLLPICWMPLPPPPSATLASREGEQRHE